MTNPLRAIIESLDDLPATIDPRDLFVPGEGELEGKYVLRIDESDGYGVANASKLHSALDAERKARAKAERMAKTIEKDIATARERMAALEEQMASGIPDAAGAEKTIRAKVESEFQRKLEAARAQLEEQIAALSSERDGFSAQVRDLLVDSVIASGETPKHAFRAKLLAPHLRSRVQVERDEDTGQMVRRFLDSKGQPGFRGDGTPWDLDDVLTEVSRTDPDFAALITAKNGQPGRGSAAPARSSGGHPAGPLRLSLDELRANPIAATKLADEAMAAGREVIYPDAYGGA